MRRFDPSRCCRLAVGVVMGLALNSALQADDTGVVRISDRTAQPVIRAQSPDGSLIDLASCQSGSGPATCNSSCPPHGVCGPSHGLVVGTAPTWSDDDWEDCQSHSSNLVDCPHCHPGQNCRHCGSRGCTNGGSFGCGSGNKLIDCLSSCCDKILGSVHDRFGFDESGGNGAGVPLVGHYVLTYPVNPTYFDGRDGQVYAAPGYGGPVSVPLAPIVRHTYNYGWGIPSSRLTPISHPIPPSP